MRPSGQYQYRLASEQMESSPAKEHLEVLVGEGQDMSQQYEISGQKANHILGFWPSALLL